MHHARKFFQNFMSSQFLTMTYSSTLNELDFSPARTTLPGISIKLDSASYLLWKAQEVLILHGDGLSWVCEK
jgi:hypothetical protein